MSAHARPARGGLHPPGFDGLEAPSWLPRWLEAGLGGVVLFARNVDEPRAAAAADGRAARGARRRARRDRRGGRRRHAARARRRELVPGHLALGAVDDVELTERVARGDRARPRARSGEPRLRARRRPRHRPARTRHRRALVRLRPGARRPARRGIRARASRGRGSPAARSTSRATARRTRTRISRCRRSRADRETLRRGELVPFRAAIEAGVRPIMTAHVRRPARSTTGPRR